jgi:hypothetical protein
VHNNEAREKREARGVRLPVSLWRMIDAVKSQDGDATPNDTIARALTEWCIKKLSRAA